MSILDAWLGTGSVDPGSIDASLNTGSIGNAPISNDISYSGIYSGGSSTPGQYTTAAADSQLYNQLAGIVAPYTNAPSSVNLGSLNTGSQDWGTFLSKLGNRLQSVLSNPAQVISLGLGLGSILGGWNKPTSAAYQGKIPNIHASRSVIPGAFPQAPTAATWGQPHMGRNYFTPVTYTGAAKGGYLSGNSDGMADQLSTSIDGVQPAKLSHGEFVVPADVVSHLGNGNSDAGANVLYNMLDKVRKARTGNEKQGKEINPEKFTNFAGGGVVAFDAGGATQSPVATATPTSTPQVNVPQQTPPYYNPYSLPQLSPTQSISQSSGLSPWAGDYITNMLGQAQGLAQTPYQAYQGPLTAGTSPLQQQGYNAISGWTTPESLQQAATNIGNTASQVGPVGSVQDYMSPYIKDVVQQQEDEARRQSDITRNQTNAQLAQAGAYGGSRQQIADTEIGRNLGILQNQIASQGYNTAWNNALNQRLQTGQLQGQLGSQLGSVGTQQANAGLAGIQNLLNAGTTQQATEQQGINADINQYNQQLNWPYQQLQFQQSMLQGLPVGTSTQSVGISPWASVGQGILNGIGTLGGLTGGTGPTNLGNLIQQIFGSSGGGSSPTNVPTPTTTPNP